MLPLCLVLYIHDASHSTCPPLSSLPHANSFAIGPAVIKHTRPQTTSSKIMFSLSSLVLLWFF